MVSRNILFGLYAACVLLYESSACPLPKLAPRHKCGLAASSRTKVLSKTSLTCPTAQSQAPLLHFASCFPPIVTNDSFLTLNIT